MLTPEERSAVGAVTTQLRIIIGALLAGVLSYAAFAVFLSSEPLQRESNLAPIAAAMAAAGAVAAIIVPRIIAVQQRQQVVEGKSSLQESPAALNAAGDAGQLLMGYQTRRIIAAALLEGPAFFNTFVYQTERVPYALGIVGALALGLIMLLPIRALVEQWLEDELRAVRELRQLRG